MNALHYQLSDAVPSIFGVQNLAQGEQFPPKILRAPPRAPTMHGQVLNSGWSLIPIYFYVLAEKSDR